MTAQERWTEIDGIRVHYLEAGNGGLPVVMIHGGSGDSATLSWKASAEQLGRCYWVLAPDLPGFGRSEKPRITYDLEFFTQFLNSFAEKFQLTRFDLVGLSLGGQIALNFVLRKPRQVRKLVLVSCAGIDIEMRWPIVSRLMLTVPGLHKKVRKVAGQRREAVRMGLRNIIHDPAAITDELVDAVAEGVSNPGEGYAWRSYLKNEIDWSGFRHNLLERLAEIQPPTLILHGREDQLIPLSTAEKAHRRIPDSLLQIFSGCGHWPPRERPEEFHRAVREFLDG